MTSIDPVRAPRGGSLAAMRAAAFIVAASVAVAAFAGPREQARRLHDRIAGVPPSDATLALMQADIEAGRPRDAADRAMQDPAFYGVTIRNLATPWTNRERTAFAPLNDYTATVIGMVRDDVPFNELLSGDILYVGRSGLDLPAASAYGNDHYAEMERRRLDFADALVRSTQSTTYGLPFAATAGVMTTRAAAQAFFVAGTNRAMFRFTVVNHLCNDLEQLQDTTRPPDRIRQDVSRSPGGDSRLFLNNCVGCHAGMDPLAQAFAYYNYDEAQGRLVYSAPAVQPKYSINADSFRPGYVTRSDRWDNYWRQGHNALLGWDAGLPGAGNGARSLGQELAGTRAFASCQVEKVFKAICLRSPGNTADRTRVATVTTAFRTSGFKLRQVVADVATYCMGE